MRHEEAGKEKIYKKKKVERPSKKRTRRKKYIER
jgi:hypothetical protein